MLEISRHALAHKFFFSSSVAQVGTLKHSLKRYRDPVSHRDACGFELVNPLEHWCAIFASRSRPVTAAHKSKRPQVFSLRPSGRSTSTSREVPAVSRQLVDLVNYRRRPAIQDVGRSHVTCGSTRATALEVVPS